jgi:hypothetical protein
MAAAAAGNRGRLANRTVSDPSDEKMRPQVRQLRGQPTVRVSQAGQRPGGPRMSRSDATGPSATPNRNQMAHGRARWSASQLASGANSVAETTNATIGNESPGTVPPGQPMAAREQW